MTKRKAETSPDELEIQIKSQNEIESLQELYGTATQELDSDNTEQAILLFRGVVHECDKLLRIRNMDANGDENIEKQKAELEILPSQFYDCYANALYNLSQLDSNEPSEFLKLALELSGSAIEIEKSIGNMFSMGRILVQLVAFDPSEYKSQLEDLISKYVELLQSLGGNEKDDAISFLKELLQSSLSSTDLSTNRDTKLLLIKFVLETCHQITESFNSDVDICTMIGNCHLVQADLLMESMEQDTDHLESIKEKETITINHLKTAINSFQSAIEQSSPTPNLLLLLGECHCHLGNILDSLDEELSIKEYKKAVEYFQRVEKDLLPEQFQEFLIEWTKDLN